MTGYSPKSASISDEDFIKVWHQTNGEVSRVATEVGMTVRAAYARRRSVEQRSGLTLVAQSAATRAVIRRHKARISLKIKDAVSDH